MGGRSGKVGVGGCGVLGGEGGKQVEEGGTWKRGMIKGNRSDLWATCENSRAIGCSISPSIHEEISIFKCWIISTRSFS